MSQKEKRIIVIIITTVLILIIYSLFVYFTKIDGNPEILNDFKFWGITFLILVPISIVSQIVIQILFAIVNAAVTKEAKEEITDERDKAIELKSNRISHWIFTAGFLISMGTLAFGTPPYVFFISLIASGFLSSIISELVKLYFYRRGF